MHRRRFLAQVAAGSTALPWLLSGRTSLLAAEADGLIVHSSVPMNAEPPLEELIQSWMTPVEKFYIRSHAPVPKIDKAAFRLTVKGLVERELSLSLDELAELKEYSTVATLTCAGNRRYEHSRTQEVKGVPWREGAIGNARWSGVRLSDVLKKAGLRAGARHVWFDGLDRIQRDSDVIPFGASIPVGKALADDQEMPGALLATGMNGEALTGDHGWPLRAVVPGYIGARSVKWLGSITVSDRPSPNHYVADAYKLVDQGTPLEWNEAGPIYRYPVNSVICTPTAGAVVKPGRVKVAGYALPAGDPSTTVTKVELSSDGGRTWKTAKITSKVRQQCWVLWEAELPITAQTEELMVRAIDSRGHQQPQRVDWNLKGYLFNAWHQVPIRT